MSTIRLVLASVAFMLCASSAHANVLHPETVAKAKRDLDRYIAKTPGVQKAYRKEVRKNFVMGVAVSVLPTSMILGAASALPHGSMMKLPVMIAGALKGVYDAASYISTKQLQVIRDEARASVVRNGVADHTIDRETAQHWEEAGVVPQGWQLHSSNW